MTKKNVTFFFLLIFTIISILFIYQKNLKEKKIAIEDKIKSNEPAYNSNIIKDIEYTSKDSKGNEYIIKALEGEIDYSNPNIIFLKKVTALINLKNSNNIKITSNFGKYNSSNYDTIFSKNVVIDYLDNNIKSNYLDFSFNRNLMIISKDVVYSNSENILKSDVVEIDIETKDTKIFMNEKNKKVILKSKN